LTCPEEDGDAAGVDGAGDGPPLGDADFEDAGFGFGVVEGLLGAGVDGSARRVEDARGLVSSAVAPATVMGSARGGS